MPRWAVKVPWYMNFIVVQKSMFKFLDTASTVIQTLTPYNSTALDLPEYQKEQFLVTNRTWSIQV